MKYSKVLKRVFTAIGNNKEHSDFLGEGIITKETLMSTGYVGRGILPQDRTFAVGTEVTFKLAQYKYGDEIYCDFDITTKESFVIIQNQFITERAQFKKSCKFNGTLEEVAEKLGFNKMIEDGFCKVHIS